MTIKSLSSLPFFHRRSHLPFPPTATIQHWKGLIPPFKKRSLWREAQHHRPMFPLAALLLPFLMLPFPTSPIHRIQGTLLSPCPPPHVPRLVIHEEASSLRLILPRIGIRCSILVVIQLCFECMERSSDPHCGVPQMILCGQVLPVLVHIPVQTARASLWAGQEWTIIIHTPCLSTLLGNQAIIVCPLCFRFYCMLCSQRSSLLDLPWCAGPSEREAIGI